MGAIPASRSTQLPDSAHFVCYRAPQGSAIQVLTGTWHHGFPDTSGAQLNFVLAPFNPNTQPSHLQVESQTTYDRLFEPGLSRNLPALTAKELEKIEGGAEAYQRLVSQAIASINQGLFTKLVASHTARLPLVLDKDAQMEFFQELCVRYPSAFVYWLSHPEYGTWLAATPERLIQAEGGLISTDALAGTKPVSEVLAAQASGGTAFTEKEIQEHAHVVHYITDAIGQLGIPVTISQSEVSTKMAGPVAHLHASIDIEVGSEDSEEVLQKLIGLMHPTSATCGSPKAEAVAWLKAHERYDRSLYAGYLGPVMGTEASLYVNLRCMQVHSDSVQLYVGAGITAASVPEAEWRETLVKAQTLLAPFQEEKTQDTK